MVPFFVCDESNVQNAANSFNRVGTTKFFIPTPSQETHTQIYAYWYTDC